MSLVTVAVVRDPDHATPLHSARVGAPSNHRGVEVETSVYTSDPPEAMGRCSTRHVVPILSISLIDVVTRARYVDRMAPRSFDGASEPASRFRRAHAMAGLLAARRRCNSGMSMKLRIGYEMIYDFPQSTPVILVLGIHFTRSSDVIVPDTLTASPSVPISSYRDVYGNLCSRIVAPPGRMRLSADGVVRDSGLPDLVAPSASQHPVEELPAETLLFLLGSRYCETQRLSDIAWSLFEKSPPGWARVQAICDFVHRHITFGYEYARATMTSWEVFDEAKGVCRDYAHLAITFCRCMNIPARYCTGYLGDIGVPPPYGPMDFAGWFEAYLGGRWYTFDARNNIPRIGRVLIAQGRDAADVPITHTFGPNTLVSFRVWTEEVS